MDQDGRNRPTDNGEVTTLRDYLAIVACLFGAFFFSMILAIGLAGAAKAAVNGFDCLAAHACSLSDIPDFSDTQWFVFALTAGGMAVIFSGLSLPLFAIGGGAALRFRLHLGLTRNFFTGAGFLSASAYGAMLIPLLGQYAGIHKLWICGFAMPLAGALACWGVYPMLRKPQIPNVFSEE